ncbi:MAG: VOC family protein [Thaumarchaeota archaeon]|nr:VOC family protein [Nitrososphaerota archaeon]
MAKKSVKSKKQTKPKKLPPVPAGFRTVTPYLSVAGAASAIEFYKKAFGARELMRNAAPDGSIMHARLKIGDSIVMLSDQYPDPGESRPATFEAGGVILHLYSKNVDGMWKDAIAAGAKVVLALDNQYWGERYGQLLDPFGHRWSLSMQVRMSREEKEAKQKAAMAMFSQGEHPEKSG